MFAAAVDTFGGVDATFNVGADMSTLSADTDVVAIDLDVWDRVMTVNLRGYKQGQYLSPYMSSVEAEERFSFNARWGATLFVGASGLYGQAPSPLDRSIYPSIGAGLQFVLKPVQRMNVNLEYAQGVGDSRGVYLKLGYAW